MCGDLRFADLPMRADGLAGGGKGFEPSVPRKRRTVTDTLPWLLRNGSVPWRRTGFESVVARHGVYARERSFAHDAVQVRTELRWSVKLRRRLSILRAW